MSPRGGYRPGSGQPPIAGTPQTERISLKLTEGERAEIEAAIPEGHPVGRWIVEAALMRARDLTAIETGRRVSNMTNTNTASESTSRPTAEQLLAIADLPRNTAHAGQARNQGAPVNFDQMADEQKWRMFADCCWYCGAVNAVACGCTSRTTDQSWTRFVRQWRDLMRRLFLPLCSRSEPCCEHECNDMAEHFGRTGDVP